MHCHVIRPRVAVSRRAAVSLVAVGCIAAAGLSGCSSSANHDEHGSRTTGDSGSGRAWDTGSGWP